MFSQQKIKKAAKKEFPDALKQKEEQRCKNMKERLHRNRQKSKNLKKYKTEKKAKIPKTDRKCKNQQRYTEPERE